MALFIAVQIHSYPVDARFSLQNCDIKWRAKLKSHIVKNRHPLNAMCSQHPGKPRNAPTDLILLVSNPIQMPGHISTLPNLAIAWGINCLKRGIHSLIGRVERLYREITLL